MTAPFRVAHPTTLKRQVLGRLVCAHARWHTDSGPRADQEGIARQLLANWAHAHRFELSGRERRIVDAITHRLRREQGIMQLYLAQPFGMASVHHVPFRTAHHDDRQQQSLLELFAYCDDEALATYAARRHATSLAFAEALGRRRRYVVQLEKLIHDHIEQFASIGEYLNGLLYAYCDLARMPPGLKAITEKYILASVAFETRVRHRGLHTDG